MKKTGGEAGGSMLNIIDMNSFDYLRNFACLNDGRYSIYNSIAERFIRPLVGEHKNSLFFGGNLMANVSAAYHTLISTCRANSIAILAYLKKFFREVVESVGTMRICC